MFAAFFAEALLLRKLNCSLTRGSIKSRMSLYIVGAALTTAPNAALTAALTIDPYTQAQLVSLPASAAHLAGVPPAASHRPDVRSYEAWVLALPADRLPMKEGVDES